MVYANSAIGDEDDCEVVMCIPQNDEQEPWTWCVIANVVDEHEVGVDHHIDMERRYSVLEQKCMCRLNGGRA